MSSFGCWLVAGEGAAPFPSGAPTPTTNSLVCRAIIRSSSVCMTPHGHGTAFPRNDGRVRFVAARTQPDAEKLQALTDA
jgi:hypothetical protein